MIFYGLEIPDGAEIVEIETSKVLRHGTPIQVGFVIGFMPANTGYVRYIAVTCAVDEMKPAA